MGVGLLLFHDQQAVFPSSGGYAGDPIYLVQYDIRDGPDAGQRIGIGYPDRVPEEQTGSWVYAIRPCLDRRANADAGPSGGRDIALPMLLCPAHGRPALQPVPTRDPIYAGMAYQSVPEDGGSWGKSDYSCNGLAIPPHSSRFSAWRSLGDGLSSTILVGEKALDPQAYQTGGWYEDGPVFAGGLGISRTGTLVVCDEIDPARSPTGASSTTGGRPIPAAPFPLRRRLRSLATARQRRAGSVEATDAEPRHNQRGPRETSREETRSMPRFATLRRSVRTPRSWSAGRHGR